MQWCENIYSKCFYLEVLNILSEPKIRMQSNSRKYGLQEVLCIKEEYELQPVGAHMVTGQVILCRVTGSMTCPFTLWAPSGWTYCQVACPVIQQSLQKPCWLSQISKWLCMKVCEICDWVHKLWQRCWPLWWWLSAITFSWLIFIIRPNTIWTKWMISCKSHMDYQALMLRI